MSQMSLTNKNTIKGSASGSIGMYGISLGGLLCDIKFPVGATIADDG